MGIKKLLSFVIGLCLVTNTYGASLSRGKTFTSTEEVTNTKLHELVDNGGVTDIAQADLLASYGLLYRGVSALADTDSLWFDSVNNLLKVYGTSGWVEIPTILSPSSGQVLRYNGTNWVGYADTAYEPSANKSTDGTFADNSDTKFPSQKATKTYVDTYAIPSGIICMWSGTIATIPSGWYLCDGNNGTPDLRNRFIVAADADDGGVAKSTVTGSALQTSDGVVLAHNHTAGTLTGGAHTHNVALGVSGSGNGVSGNPFQRTGASPNAAESAGAVAVTGSTANNGSSTKNIAVFYALAYIMKG